MLTILVGVKLHQKKFTSISSYATIWHHHKLGECLPFWRRNMEIAGSLRREYGTKSSQIRVHTWRMDSDRNGVHEFENFVHRNP